MALKAGYVGVKKNDATKLKDLPGIKEIGEGLTLADDGTLTGDAGSVIANGEGVPTYILNKLQVGETIYQVPFNDNSACYQITDDTESAIVDADYIPFLDSSASSGDGAPKKSTWTNFVTKVLAKMTDNNTTDGVVTDFTFDTNGKTVFKQGNIVMPYIRITGVSVTGDDVSTPICTLAEGYRPPNGRLIPIIVSGQFKTASIYTSGKIVSTETLSNSTVTIMIPWFV